MSKPTFAATRRVNPPGVTPVLTHEQVWKGLNLKSRDPKSFITVVTSSDLLSDEGNKVVRSISANNGPAIKETITLYGNTIAYLEMENGIRMTNTISVDENGELLLTFSFANGFPGIPEGFDVSALTVAEKNNKMGGAVQHAIDRFRELAKAGAL